jgi:hypothetical protein
MTLRVYTLVVNAVQNDHKLYELLAIVEAIKVGRAREKELAINELQNRIINGEQITEIFANNF